MIEVDNVFQKQQAFFTANNTKPIANRIDALNKLKTMIIQHEEQVTVALKTDLNKSAFESYSSEIGFVLAEITYTLKHLRKWAKPKRVKTPLTHLGAKSFVYKEPYGVSLIISPWNYPFQLAMAPLIGAIAAGNTAIIKPSEHASATSQVLQRLISDTFAPEYIAVIEGDAGTTQALLAEPFDYIFFTGSPAVGKIVMSAAAKHLTPVTLELGGKSPCIVADDANITLAAKRIVWGKLLNAGQTCVAPDYLLVHESIQEPLLKEMTKCIRDMYGELPLANPDYPKIVNEHHFTRLKLLIAGTKGEVYAGGKINEQTLHIEPTLLSAIEWDDPVMQEEIFGPILPVISYTNIDAAILQVTTRDKPLALYLFTEDKRLSEKITTAISFGSGCINDTVFQLATPHLPFGGVGTSGMGAYHGKHSFDTFSHTKSMLKQTTQFDIPLRYPNTKNGLKMIRWFMK